ncbi:MAG: hypothetical protein AB7S26_03335 [Sandaracinaceae bacterium]
MTGVRLGAALLVLGWSTQVSAQVLTVEIEAEGELPAGSTATLRVAPGALVESQSTLRASSSDGAAPVLVVVPPSGDATAESARESAAPPPRPAVAPVPPPAVVTAPSEPPKEDEDLQAAVHAAIFVDAIDLSGLTLDFNDPEIRALDGIAWDPSYAGQHLLRDTVMVGGSVGVGIRAWRYLRGPEIRLQLGGVDYSDEAQLHPLATAPDGLTFSIQRGILFRLETVFGLQVELGPVVPYAMVRAALGGVWIDVGVESRDLGYIGGETLDAAVLELGIEAGLEVKIPDGPRLGAAFRGSFLGTPSLGGALTMTFVGPE